MRTIVRLGRGGLHAVAGRGRGRAGVAAVLVAIALAGAAGVGGAVGGVASAGATTLRRLPPAAPVAALPSTPAPATAPTRSSTPTRTVGPVARRSISLGGVIGTILSPVSAGAGVLATAGLSAVQNWVLGGVRGALVEAAHVIGEATAPQLESSWFSSTYWRVAGLAMLLTLPFLFAAALQALVRSDLTLVLRSAFGYLPAAVLGVSIASQLVMALLAATDEMSSVVSGAGVDGGSAFLTHTALLDGTMSVLGGSAFFTFLIGLVTVAAALGVTLELLVRAAAVYVVMLMLPLAFAALVWPARRIWAIRLGELLVALILSKFVIVAVLSLAGAAYDHDGIGGVNRMLTAMSLLMLSCFAPWAMMRLLPFAELAAGTAGALRASVPSSVSPTAAARAIVPDWASAGPGLLGRHTAEAGQGFAGVGGMFATPRAAGRSSGHGPGSNGSGGPASDAGGGLSPVRPDAEATRPDLRGAAPETIDSARGHEPSAPGAARRERLSGLHPMFMMDDDTWPPLHLDSGDWWGGAEPPGGSMPSGDVVEPPGGSMPSGAVVEPPGRALPSGGGAEAPDDGPGPAR